MSESKTSASRESNPLSFILGGTGAVGQELSQILWIADTRWLLAAAIVRSSTL
jgi:hypothetical protein